MAKSSKRQGQLTSEGQRAWEESQQMAAEYGSILAESDHEWNLHTGCDAISGRTLTECDQAGITEEPLVEQFVDRRKGVFIAWLRRHGKDAPAAEYELHIDNPKPSLEEFLASWQGSRK